MFLQVQRAEKKRHIIRQLLVGSTVLVAVCLGMGTYLFSASLLQETSQHLASVIVPQTPVAQAGGDVTAEPKIIEPVAPPEPVLPTLSGILPDEEDFSAYALVVKDHETGTVLFQKSPYSVWPIASITKLMSALVLLEQDIDWSLKSVVVSDDVSGTHMYPGDTYTNQELWDAGLVASSNKAILTLSDASGLTREEFVLRMNEKAAELGMEDSMFVEPTGLNAGNIASAADISLLLAEAFRHEKIIEAVTTDEISLYSLEREKRHDMWNTNWILLGWIPTELHMLGGKTGYIGASGYNFTGRFEDENGKILDVVTLGTNAHEARFTEAVKIAEEVLDIYDWPGEKFEEEEKSEEL